MYIQRAELWKDFDVDKHCRGAYVVWDLKETNKVEKNFAVTPASNPISFSKVQETDRGKKWKRNEQNWEQKRKKHSREARLSNSPYKVYTILKELRPA